MATKYAGQIALNKLMQLVKTALNNKADKTNATTSAAGLMSAADKTKLDGTAADTVRYGAAQTLTEGQKSRARDNIDAPCAFAPILTSPVMIRKFGETASAGVYLSTIDTGEKAAEIKFEDVNENSPVAIANLRTPTGTGTDDYAATKGYVDRKVASGGVTVDTALSDTSVNPVQNKTIKAALDGKAGTAAATQSADGLLSAADKKKLDSIATGATKVTVDAAMSDTSENPVQNKAILSVLNKKAAASDLALKADKANPNFTGSIRLQEESGGDFHVTAAVRPFDDKNISLNFEPESPNSSYAGVVIDCLATVEADLNGWPQVAVNQEMMEKYVGKKVSGLQTADQVQDAIKSAVSGVYTPKGSIAFASLPTPAAGNKGWVYNITDAFTTTAAFVEGAGHSYGAGTNVVCVDVGSGSYKWDVLAGTIDLTELTADEVQTLWNSI